ITNGGTFGSMMSTPIINPPQSAILGMHAITPRPVAETGQGLLRPMMYLAPSRDPRNLDFQAGRPSLRALQYVRYSPDHPMTAVLGGGVRGGKGGGGGGGG
ncbi:2-oxo acid dehydrogenase subunit E2, partial [Escherichia coli]|uniref:2-oxo acid dehydrogenase subunit E2 n=1 Tax=Escherichia coli TaxID=562 RepID=UPI001484F08F